MWPHTPIVNVNVINVKIQHIHGFVKIQSRHGSVFFFFFFEKGHGSVLLGRIVDTCWRRRRLNNIKDIITNYY